MNQHLEVEAKFSVSESTQIPNLGEITGVDRVDRTEIHNLSAVYFDTEDLRLTRSKITLRRRTGGNDAGWHIKFPGEVGRREVQASLDAEGASESSAPKELLGHIRALVQGRPLLPIAQVDNERHMSYLVNAEGELLAEFCDDHVSTVSYLPGGVRKQWREWELELSDAALQDETGMALLENASQTLQAAGAFPSSSPSKLSSALDNSINYAPTPPQMAELEEGDPARGVLAAIAANATKIAEYDPKVRADEYDSVHQMRVATRELRSHLQTFEGILGGEEYLKIEKELKVLATILGRARDAEVIEERLASLVETEIGDAIEESTKQELLEDLRAEYQREHARVVRALDDDRYTNLLQSLEDLLVNPPLVTEGEEEAEKAVEIEPATEQSEPATAEAAFVEETADNAETEETPADDSVEAAPEAEVTEEPVNAAPQENKEKKPAKVDAALVLLTHLDKAHAKLVKLDKKARKEWANSELSAPEREENYHNVRKAAKKLRYSAEAVSKATDVNTKKLYKACSTLQSVLGDFQDAITSREELLRRAKAASRQQRDTFAYGVLYQHEHTLSRSYLEGYPEAFKEVEKAYEKLEEETAKRVKKSQRK